MRLYYDDAYRRQFQAQVVDTAEEGKRVYLDRTAFYPSSGGQPFDLGSLNGVSVIDVVDEEDRIAHVLNAPIQSGSVTGVIDWTRRFDHMQQHTGQHLLSAVLHDRFGIATLSFHLGNETSTIDVAAAALSPAQIQEAEKAANEIVFENRLVQVTYEDAASVEGLRKASQREGTLRVVSIDKLDRSACGGTHVKATGEIGPILLRRLDKIRGNVRLEFVCGGRAVARARADYDALNQAAQYFSSPLDDVPALVKAAQSKLQDSEKARRKLSAELAGLRGRERYQSTRPGDSGLRHLHVEVATIDEDARAEAQGFIAESKALLLLTTSNPPSLLLAASADAGQHAGTRISEVVKPLGGRGGGNAAMAQASVPDSEALQKAVKALGF